MPDIITYRNIILAMIWLYHLATALNINTGYYVNPFLQQPLNQHASVPQLIWSKYISLGHNTVTNRDRTNVDNENQVMTRDNPVVDDRNQAMTRENPVVDDRNQAMTRENPVVDDQNQAMTRENPLVDDQNQAMTRENPLVDDQNQAMTLENPVVDDRNQAMTRKNPVIDNHNCTIIRETPVVENQNYAMARQNSVVVSRDQNLEDYSFKHTQPKCSSYPHQGTKELTHRGGDSVPYGQQGESDDKHISGGDVLVGNRTNHTSAGSADKLLPTTADPSRCVWAIISCCSPGSSNVRNPCFELLGCPGPFWDTKPCNERITGAALKVVGEFYSNGKRE
jgi:hypothetical protein